AALHFFSHAYADLLHGAQVSELALGLLPRGFRRPALSDQVVNFRPKMKAQFVSYIGRRVGSKQPGVAAPHRNRLHATSSGNGGCVAPSTFATALAYASQVFTSERS